MIFWLIIGALILAVVSFFMGALVEEYLRKPDPSCLVRRLTKDLRENPQDWDMTNDRLCHKSNLYILSSRYGECLVFRPGGYSDGDASEAAKTDLKSAIDAWHVWKAEQHLGVDEERAAAVEEVENTVGGKRVGN